MKSDKKSNVPKWIGSERASDYFLLKTNLPDLFQKAGLDDPIWKDWMEINDCERKFPSDIKLSLFQQIIVIQALRPDRLQTVMREFSCKILNLKDISPSSTNIRHIYEKETVASEPILIIISAGSDPSDELRELAESTIGKNSYHEVFFLV